MQEDIYNHLQTFISIEKARKIGKMIKLEDRIRHLVSDLLVRFVINNQLKIPNSQIQFHYNSYGKPFITEAGQPFHFNVSHAGAYVVCAIDTVLVGADIECIKDIDLSLVNMVLTKKELEELTSVSEEQKLHYFYSRWTLKESLVKHVGRGLQIPLNDIHIQKDALFHCEFENKKYFFQQYELEIDYILSVCSSKSAFDCEIIQLDFQYLYDFVVKQFS
ncbi:4'-phosphopantetheinyl transferase superfamily protein [Paenibacillus sp. N3.4]|uniref:4'-phosphopantetheinyl transferase family protein n=1 Tax=Paenibacillus sp. N3.4 TaxID=2603222 RepID=UPI001C9C1036|nr:4'-phosphopantetheinyl transferase superfamily protein [Paenibacillus sp. N3.4]